MLEKLNERSVSLSWTGVPPDGNHTIALLIPQYNEASNCNLEIRLAYFGKMATELGDFLDIIIIDDGSTDESLALIRKFKAAHPETFYVASVSPNANKVGALYLAISAVAHEFIILSDFDTDIKGLGELRKRLPAMRGDRLLMGCYFRMLPFEGEGNVFGFQQLEYSMARSLYKFHKKDGSVPVMPGAGSCYKRKALMDIYSTHSGLRSGEDREATLLGLKMGYKCLYADDILALTRPPLSFQSLVKQRVRWNLGYLETMHKEKNYYRGQIKVLSKMGIRTLAELISVNLTILLPLLLVAGVVANLKLLFIFAALIYVSCVLWSVGLILLAPEESAEIRRKRKYLVLYYPFYKLSLDCIAWTGAILSFHKKRKAENVLLITTKQTNAAG